MSEPTLSKVLRERAAKLYDPNNSEGDRDTAELLCCLARLVAGKTVHKAFGAPGDWGYGTPIGDALKDFYNSPMTGVEMIQAERIRQMDEEGWSMEHDDEHVNAELVEAAVGYADTAAMQVRGNCAWMAEPKNWPWEIKWWKPSEHPMVNLKKAGALIAGEKAEDGDR
jgi:hypothetical protein